LLQVAAECHHFEGFAHLPGQEQSAGFAGEASTIRHVGRFRSQSFDTSAEEEGRLRSKASDLEVGIQCGFPDASEVDPGCDVLDGDVSEGIVVRSLFEVAAQRAIYSLRMIVVRARQTVVEEEEHALVEALTNTRYPRLDAEADF
jgi:hypothetical protein